jgi:hypothetical protein
MSPNISCAASIAVSTEARASLSAIVLVLVLGGSTSAAPADGITLPRCVRVGEDAADEDDASNEAWELCRECIVLAPIPRPALAHAGGAAPVACGGELKNTFGDPCTNEDGGMFIAGELDIVALGVGVCADVGVPAPMKVGRGGDSVIDGIVRPSSTSFTLNEPACLLARRIFSDPPSGPRLGLERGMGRPGVGVISIPFTAGADNGESKPESKSALVFTATRGLIWRRVAWRSTRSGRTASMTGVIITHARDISAVEP